MRQLELQAQARRDVFDGLPLATLASACAAYTCLKHIRFHDVEQFWRFAYVLIREIQLVNGQDTLPIRLPLYVHEFLRDALSIEDQQTVALWDVLREPLWEVAGPYGPPSGGQQGEDVMLTDKEREVFERLGSRGERKTEKISHTILYPPYLRCTRCKCLMKKHSRYAVTFYSLRYGARLAYASSLSCEGCKTRYYHNYYCLDTIRVFYRPSVPTAIHFEEHAFIEPDVCEFFTSLMLFAWVSGSNCAHIYNHSFARSSTLKLRTEQVWTAFFLNALLRDRAEHNDYLTLSESGSNDTRLKIAMEKRNLQMIREGQPHLMHACNICEKLVPGGTGHKGLRSLRAVVIDGVLVPFPCCKEHNCSIPLSSNRDHYCTIHKGQAKTCIFPDCILPTEPGHQTCTVTEHRNAEKSRHQRKKAFFQLKARLSYSTAGQVTDSMDHQNPANEVVEFDELEGTRYSEHKSDEGNEKISVRFNRRRTHNEELVVCCCGVIAARATMYGAEAISGVKDFLKSIYRHNPANLPDVIFFDNNCQLQEHLQTQGDHFFKQCILAVDVFHFEKKHSEKHEFCQKHCNPASWPELYNDAGDWVFNSSAAEQANAWIGGYLSITRDMLAHRFTFFIDEMIKRRNEKLVTRLREQGEAPYNIPCSLSDAA